MSSVPIAEAGLRPVVPSTTNLPDGGTAIQSGAADDVPFESMLRDALTTHENHAWMAHQAGEAFAAGTRDDIHGTMIALKEADIELRVIANVRNKILDAFNDLLRMNV